MKKKYSLKDLKVTSFLTSPQKVVAGVGIYSYRLDCLPTDGPAPNCQ
jgi:hypothetical protein